MLPALDVSIVSAEQAIPRVAISIAEDDAARRNLSIAGFVSGLSESGGLRWFCSTFPEIVVASSRDRIADASLISCKFVRAPVDQRTSGSEQVTLTRMSEIFF